MVVRQRPHPGAEPDVLGPLGRGGDEHLRTGDEFVTAGMMFTEPGLVVAEPVQCDGALQVVFQCYRGRLADRVERRDEHPELQWSSVHYISNPARNVSRASLTCS